MNARAVILLALLSLPAVANASTAWDPWQTTPAAPSAGAGLSDETSATRIAGWVAIRIYQHTLSGLLPGACQFEPSCSAYTLRCVASHGLLNGVWMGADRISRCHGYAILGGYPVARSGALIDPPDDLAAPLPVLGGLGL
jgi:hypothetical protein